MRRALADARKHPDKEIIIDVADEESFEYDPYTGEPTEEGEGH